MRSRRRSERSVIKELFSAAIVIAAAAVCLLPCKTAMAAEASASEIERMESFSAYVQKEDLTDAVVGFGDFSDVSDAYPTDAGAADHRMQEMLEQMAAMDAEYGPVVRDVVTVISSPDRGSGTEQMRMSEMSYLAGEAESYGNGGGAVQAAPGDGTFITAYDPEYILRAAEQQVLTGVMPAFDRNSLSALRVEIDGAVSGENFPTTNWRRFGTELVDLGTFVLTAYDPCMECCGKTDGITATGTKGKTGRTIAVDPAVIPYGTRVVIGGYVYIAEDTGSAIKGRHIDMFMDTHEIAMQFGKRTGQVYLIR